jgi:hypothetical protein
MERIDNGLALEDETPAWGDQAEYDRLMTETEAAGARWALDVPGLDRRFGPLDERTARRLAGVTAEHGHASLLLRRDGDGDAFVVVERVEARSRLVAVNGRPYSHWRR